MSSRISSARIEPGKPQLRKVDSTTSTPFLGKSGRVLLICTVYPDSGDSWQLQVKSPLNDSSDAEVWVDTGIEVDGVGQTVEWTSPFFYYRFNGGTTGTEIWVTPAYSGV